MIVKIKSDAGWTYLDDIEEFRTYGKITGTLTDADPNADVFSSCETLAPAVARVWGPQREFDREIWPPLNPNEQARYVEAGVARRSDGSDVLVLWADEAFLLSDDGKTIDRLR